MIKFTNKQVIDVQDWDQLVVDTYGKPYSFQQQDGCKERQTVDFSVPDEPYHYSNDTLPYVINGEQMGVSFEAWKATDSNEYRSIFWARNFYPDFQTVANDLHAKGLLPAGDYTIDIDW